jgi:histidine ammonia-lyase
MGMTAGLKLRQIAANLEIILSLEMLCAAQGIDFRFKRNGGKLRLGVGTREVYRRMRDSIPFIEADTYMKPHLDAALQVVREWKPLE